MARNAKSNLNTERTEDFHGQYYFSPGIETVLSKADKPLLVRRWRSFCAVCGEPITFTQWVRKPFMPLRRCKAHKGTGRVDPDSLHPLARSDFDKPESIFD